MIAPGKDEPAELERHTEIGNFPPKTLDPRTAHGDQGQGPCTCDGVPSLRRNPF